MPESVEEYVLMPQRGLLTTLPLEFNILVRFKDARSTLPPQLFNVTEAPGIQGLVVDSIRENGPKLVEMTPQQAREFRRRQLGLRLEPVRYYHPAQPVPPPVPSPLPSAPTAPPLTLKIECAATRAPIQGAEVTAYANYAAGIGAQGVSDSSGNAPLALGGPSVHLDRLYVRPPKSGFWGMYQTSLAITNGQIISLHPVRLPFTDALRHFYGTSSAQDGQGVKVAVLDTGIDNAHPHLTVVDGLNTVRGEPNNDHGDNGSGHGTHVAGIIASHGDSASLPPGLRGLAPGVELYNYRVFGANNGTSTNYSIIKAIMNAVEFKRCDIINLSLSGDPGNDEVLRCALEDACDNGVLVVAAAGNNYRKKVQNPTLYAFNEGLVISAVGRKGTFPTGSYDESSLNSAPRGTDLDDFAADFTDIGNVSLIAPGVGILSTAPGGGYAPRSGTSMSCPVISGFAAALLSKNPVVLHANRDRHRVINLINLINSSAKSMGFPPDYEGFGMPR